VGVIGLTGTIFEDEKWRVGELGVRSSLR